MQRTYKRGFFDRYDGWRVRNVDAVFSVIPFILRTRNDAQNLFEENVPIENIEAFIRSKRDEMPELTLMHVLIAALVRLYSQKPYLNRFVVWNKIYAHNQIVMSLMIKRSIEDGGEETLVKPEFEPTDTLPDVVRRVSAEIDKALNDEADSDSTLDFFGKLPSFAVRVAAWFLMKLDNIGKLPKFIFEISPWHCSMFLTNVGSLGIGPIYHHLYEFGTCSLFVAMGKKTRLHTISEKGEREVHRYIGLKFVTDERICDGQYHALSMKLLKRILMNPAQLMEPPEKVYVDDGVRKPRID